MKIVYFFSARHLERYKLIRAYIKIAKSYTVDLAALIRRKIVNHLACVNARGIDRFYCLAVTALGVTVRLRNCFHHVKEAGCCFNIIAAIWYMCFCIGGAYKP